MFKANTLGCSFISKDWFHLLKFFIKQIGHQMIKQATEKQKHAISIRFPPSEAHN